MPSIRLLPDFFVPDNEYPGSFDASSPIRQKVRQATQGGGNEEAAQGMLKAIQNILTPEYVAKIRAVYEFNLTGKMPGRFFIDLKNGSGSAGVGSPANKADVSFTLNSDDAEKMFNGELKAPQAFMSGKIKIKGNISQAMKLEGIMQGLKGQLQKSKL